MRPALVSFALLASLLTAPLWAQGASQRLILKDGTYQRVTEYHVVGERVRYRSAERAGAWEELPTALVDWPATRAWEQEHRQVDAASPDPGEQDAATIDREAAREREAERARQPIIAPGLRLPDQSGIWGLDNYRDTPELVRVSQALGNLNRGTGHTVAPAPIPEKGARELVRIADPRSGVEFHLPQPTFYVSVDVRDDVAPEGALVVQTNGAASADRGADRHEHSDAKSQYAIVRLDLDRKTRVATGAELSGLLRPGSGAVVACHVEPMPGGRWLKVMPAQPLDFGQYALVELLGPGTLNADVWDFGIDPRAGENHGAFAPIGTTPSETP